MKKNEEVKEATEVKEVKEKKVRTTSPEQKLLNGLMKMMKKNALQVLKNAAQIGEAEMYVDKINEAFKEVNNKCAHMLFELECRKMCKDMSDEQREMMKQFLNK